MLETPVRAVAGITNVSRGCPTRRAAGTLRLHQALGTDVYELRLVDKIGGRLLIFTLKVHLSRRVAMGRRGDDFGRDYRSRSRERRRRDYSRSRSRDRRDRDRDRDYDRDRDRRDRDYDDRDRDYDRDDDRHQGRRRGRDRGA